MPLAFMANAALTLVPRAIAHYASCSGSSSGPHVNGLSCALRSFVPESQTHPGALSLASSLAPVLMEACEGRLSDIRWFRTDWQRGGAATAMAKYKSDNGPCDVVVKLPVVQRELTWTRRLQNGDADSVVPLLYASGETVGGYDLAWIVVERFSFGPLGTHWHDSHLPRIAKAAAKFHALANTFPVDRKPVDEPWQDLIHHAHDNLVDNDVPSRQRWNLAIKTIRNQLPKLLDEWHAHARAQWIHGDLHIANAMSRHGMEEGSVALIDLAEVRPGHWIEDAVYLERQLWVRPERMEKHKPVKLIAQARKALGLPVDDAYPRLATIRRGLLAATAPAHLRIEGSPRYMDACLASLEHVIREL
jgi:hypothetical protein